ncbi:hypothetical protein [Kribbella sp. NPDC049584]|uniref:hypothetical protein n=1 Tax=Kribbella sp. NPDC049584 TaxID=3154833 RepID=UPI00343DDCC6
MKKLGRDFVFALPKNDTERTVPMSGGTALVVKEHIPAYTPRPYTLPWEKTDGEPRIVKLLFRPMTSTFGRGRTTSWSGRRRFHAGVIAAQRRTGTTNRKPAFEPAEHLRDAHAGDGSGDHQAQDI